jgi:hypothetical protein
MQISSVSNAYGQNSAAAPPDPPPQQADPAGQNLPAPAQAAQPDQSGVISSPRASLTASATAVASQSVETANSQLTTSQLTAAYQSYMNAQGFYGYQSTLGAPLMG